MANMLIVARRADQCEAWTPWGPQILSTSDRKPAERRTPRKLGFKTEGRRRTGLDEAYSARPECAYDA